MFFYGFLFLFVGLIEGVKGLIGFLLGVRRVGVKGRLRVFRNKREFLRAGQDGRRFRQVTKGGVYVHKTGSPAKQKKDPFAREAAKGCMFAAFGRVQGKELRDELRPEVEQSIMLRR